MNYLHSTNISSIFRTLNKSIIFSMLAATLCSESFGVLPNSPEKEERGITTEALINSIDHMINITEKAREGCYIEKDENTDKTFIVYDVSPDELGKVLITESPEPYNFIKDIRADEGSYDIAIKEQAAMPRTVRLILVPTDMGLFCDRDLRQYCGCSFAFCSDFYEEKTYGRNIMVEGNIGIEYPNADSIFRISDGALEVQKDKNGAEWRIIPEIYRREQVIQCIRDQEKKRKTEEKIIDKTVKELIESRIEDIKKSAIMGEPFIKEESDIPSELNTSLKSIDRVINHYQEIAHQIQTVLTEDCLLYLQEKIPQILLAESQRKDPDSKYLLKIIEAVRHITECCNIDFGSRLKNSLDDAVRCAHEIFAITRLRVQELRVFALLNELEEVNELEEKNKLKKEKALKRKESLKEHMIQITSGFIDKKKGDDWKSLITDPTLKLDAKAIKEVLPVTDKRKRENKQKEYITILETIAKDFSSAFKSAFKISSKYPLKPEDFLQDIKFAAAYGKDMKGRILESFITYQLTALRVAEQKEKSLLQKASNIEKKLKELKTPSEKTSEIKKQETVEAQSATEKAKK